MIEQAAPLILAAIVGLIAIALWPEQKRKNPWAK